MQIHQRAGSSLLHMPARISWGEMPWPLAACGAPPQRVRPHHSTGCRCCCPVLPVSRHHHSSADAQVSQEGCLRCRKRRENQAGHHCESLRMLGAGVSTNALLPPGRSKSCGTSTIPGRPQRGGSLLEQQDGTCFRAGQAVASLQGVLWPSLGQRGLGRSAHGPAAAQRQEWPASGRGFCSSSLSTVEQTVKGMETSLGAFF